MHGKIFPWFNSPEEIERRKFNLRPVPDSDWFLLTPSAAKFDWEYDPQNPYGEDSELNWRSSLLDKDGYEISGGMPKFKNWGEGRSESGEYSSIDQAISKAISDQTALLTRKEDGSLIIRSVYQNQVILRTRGSYRLPQEGLYDFDTNVRNLIQEKYPNLLDPNVLPDLDLLFEYVAPQNRIVITYSEPDLIFLHAKRREDQGLLTWGKLEILASEYGFNIVSLVPELNQCKTPLELKTLIDIMEIDGTFPFEGIVVRSGPFMVKVKGLDYLSQHRLKSNFNYEAMVVICEEKNIMNEEDLKFYLETELLLDWECLSGAEEMFQTYLERKKKYENIVEEVSQFVEKWEPVSSDNIQKQFAMQVKDKEYSFVYFGMFNFPEGNEKREKVLQKFFNNIVIERN